MNVWDVGKDCGANIRYEPKKGVVAATFNKLVEKITSEKDHGESGKGRSERDEGRGDQRRMKGRGD